MYNFKELGERIIENLWNGIENKYGVETITSSSNLESMVLNQLR